MHAAVGILAGGALTHANSAFAYAFGYPSTAELIEAGGLDAILAEGTVLTHEGSERSAPLDALTRSRRRVKVAFDVRVLDAEQDIKLLRLIDQASLDHDAATMPASSAAPASPEPEPVSPEPARSPCKA